VNICARSTIEHEIDRDRDNAGGLAAMNARSINVHEMTSPVDDARSEQSTVALVRDAVDKGSELIADEVRLAKQEIAETVRGGVTALIGGAVAALGLIAFLVLAIVTVITAVSLHWAAALGFAVLFLVIAVAAAMVALRQLKRMSPLRQTTETIKEDVRWAKQQLTLGER
jgi:uncharacterized membrane protein YqjE